jgi:hypothetical protein
MNMGLGLRMGSLEWLQPVLAANANKTNQRKSDLAAAASAARNAMVIECMCGLRPVIVI